MAQILKLSEYRKKRPQAAPKPSVNGAPHYYCQRCDSDHFKLYPGGAVHCGNCSALMRNIFVSDKE